jgi:Ca-activated chloride channel family protein
MMFSFEHIEYLLGIALVVPLIIVFVLSILWKRRSKKALGDPALIDALTKNYSSKLYTWKFILLIVAFISCVVAVANLRKPETSAKEKKAGIDIIIALDVSKSMLSQDIKPTRLDRAKQCVNRLIDKLGENRIGLVVFAGQAYLQMPLTPDAAAAKLYLSNASPEMVNTQGTVVADALRVSMEAFNTKEKKYKAIVLISDGEDHDPETEKLLPTLADNGVIVNTIGVGTPEGSPITEPGTNEFKKDANGETVISKLNELELKMIAEKTNGVYQRLDNSEVAINSITASLDQLDKKIIQSGTGARQYASFYPWFLIFTIVLLVIELFIPEIKKRKS